MKLTEITIELTQQCPNCCIYCSSLSSWDKSLTLSFDKVKEVIDDAIKLGVRQINISGGEPFLHPDLIPIITYIHNQGCLCYIYSSGIFRQHNASSSIPISLLTSLVGIVDKIIFNYEAADSPTYDCIMGTNFSGYDLLRTSIRNCVSIGLCVETHIVPMNANVEQIPDIISQCTNLGVKRVSLLRMVMQGRAKQNMTMTNLLNDHLLNLKEYIQTIQDNTSISIRMGIPLSGNLSKLKCTTGISKLNIRYDGNVYPCEAFKNNEPLGFSQFHPDNIYEKRLIDIYKQSPYLSEVRCKLKDFLTISTDESCLNQYYRKKDEAPVRSNR